MLTLALAFSEATKQGTRVLLAIRRERYGGTKPPNEAAYRNAYNSTLASSATALGSMFIAEDSDGTIRRHANWTNTLSWRTAEALGKAPSKRKPDLWINYYGNPIPLHRYCLLGHPEQRLHRRLSSWVVPFL
jgi:hypothetical protein